MGKVLSVCSGLKEPRKEDALHFLDTTGMRHEFGVDGRLPKVWYNPILPREVVLATVDSLVDVDSGIKDGKGIDEEEKARIQAWREEQKRFYQSPVQASAANTKVDSTRGEGKPDSVAEETCATDLDTNSAVTDKDIEKDISNGEKDLAIENEFTKTLEEAAKQAAEWIGGNSLILTRKMAPKEQINAYDSCSMLSKAKPPAEPPTNDSSPSPSSSQRESQREVHLDFDNAELLKETDALVSNGDNKVEKVLNTGDDQVVDDATELTDEGIVICDQRDTSNIEDRVHVMNAPERPKSESKQHDSGAQEDRAAVNITFGEDSAVNDNEDEQVENEDNKAMDDEIAQGESGFELAINNIPLVQDNFPPMGSNNPQTFTTEIAEKSDNPVQAVPTQKFAVLDVLPNLFFGTTSALAGKTASGRASLGTNNMIKINESAASPTNSATANTEMKSTTLDGADQMSSSFSELEDLFSPETPVKLDSTKKFAVLDLK